MINSNVAGRRLPHRLLLWILMVAGLSAATGCASLFEESRSEVVLDFTFEENDQEWVAAYSDYPASMEGGNFEFVYDHRSLPETTNPDRSGLFLGSSNLSDDLFMFVKQRVPNLQPSTTYEVRYTIRLASDAPTECAGTGGAPGESVFLKGGGSTVEPEVVLEDERYQLNVDKGNQANRGSNALVIGTIENGNRQCQNTPYEMVTLHSQNRPVEVTTDENGVLWLFVGTDSGFEGRTELYFDSIEVRLRLQ